MSKVIITENKVLSDNWYVLRKITYEKKSRNGSLITATREAYDRGNGAVIMPYDVYNGTVILTRQFRFPTFINGNESGLLIEACAGLLGGHDPNSCPPREAEEEATT